MIILNTKAIYHTDRWDEVLTLPDHSIAISHCNRARRQRLEDAQEEMIERDISVYVENIRPKPGLPMGSEMLSLKFISDMIDGLQNVGICYDFSHAMLSGQDINEFKQYAKQIKLIHLVDSIPPHDRHMPLYAGEYPIDVFMRAIGEVDYKGMIDIERWEGIRKDWGLNS